MLIIITGKSCAGKDTLKQAFMDKGAEPLLSDTTRPMREGEEQGKQYNFIDRSEFNKDDYIEYREVPEAGKPSIFYGTPKKEIDNAQIYVTIKDRQGAEALKDYYGRDNVYVLYLDVPYAVRHRRSFIRDNGYANRDWSQKWCMRALRDDMDFKDIYSVADIIYDMKSLENIEDTAEKTLYFIGMECLKRPVEGLRQPAEAEIER